MDATHSVEQRLTAERQGVEEGESQNDSLGPKRIREGLPDRDPRE